MSEYSKLSAIEVHNILFERMEKLAKRFIEIVKERNEFKTTHGEPSLNYHMLNAPTEQLILEIMDEIDKSTQIADTKCPKCGKGLSIESCDGEISYIHLLIQCDGLLDKSCDFTEVRDIDLFEIRAHGDLVENEEKG